VRHGVATKRYAKAAVNEGTHMKDIERAKAFQRRLWGAVGKEWSEEDFHDRWIMRPYGQDWDFWYEKGLVPVTFCALCGEDEMSGVYRSNNHSRYKVKIYICDACATADEYVGNPTPVDVEGAYKGHPILTALIAGLNFGSILSAIAAVVLAFSGEWKWAGIALLSAIAGFLLWYKVHNRVMRIPKSL
jgi:hypothetical protein